MIRKRSHRSFHRPVIVGVTCAISLACDSAAAPRAFEIQVVTDPEHRYTLVNGEARLTVPYVLSNASDAPVYLESNCLDGIGVDLERLAGDVWQRPTGMLPMVLADCGGPWIRVPPGGEFRDTIYAGWSGRPSQPSWTLDDVRGTYRVRLWESYTAPDRAASLGLLVSDSFRVVDP